MKQLSNHEVKHFAEDLMGEFWDNGSKKAIVGYCAPDFVGHHNNNPYINQDMIERQEHNTNYYKSRKVVGHEVVALDDKVISKFTLVGIDCVDSSVIKETLTEIYRIEDNLVKEAWILGDLSFGYKYLNNQGVVNAKSEHDARIAKLQQVLNSNNAGIKLSTRQVECISYAMAGYTAKEIAIDLGLSPRTVEHYFDLIKDKYNCTSKRELMHKLMPENSVCYH